MMAYSLSVRVLLVAHTTVYRQAQPTDVAVLDKIVVDRASSAVPEPREESRLLSQTNYVQLATESQLGILSNRDAISAIQLLPVV
ncbi:hypothetical protein WH297_24595 [Ochrobactrum vermis]|uniref:Secreted protein n=1 Tax=Ochrobactrum vermis TaxID=1827297 RepID=A0ABU8PKX8_9HYPH|nr:hypothetical protein [Ochrobactrum vermis]PQZ24301.1 hypothetical protein CQZ93_24915 [Ochrobactrum vermis]